MPDQSDKDREELAKYLTNAMNHISDAFRRDSGWGILGGFVRLAGVAGTPAALRTAKRNREKAREIAEAYGLPIPGELSEKSDEEHLEGYIAHVLRSPIGAIHDSAACTPIIWQPARIYSAHRWST